MNKTLMAVGAHADDVELNVGGTLLKYRDHGYNVVYVMSTNNMSGILSKKEDDGTISQSRLGPMDTMERRKSEAADGAKVFGAVPIHLDHPQRHYNNAAGDGSIELRYACAPPEGVPDGAPTILTAHEDPASQKRLADLILERDPECILTHSVAQRDMEHVGTALLVTKSYWKAVEDGYKGALLHWREGHTFLGEFNCRWETFVDINGYLDKKLDAIAKHRCQIPDPYRPDFPPRERAMGWGAACGCAAAEVFVYVNRGALYGKWGPIHGDLELELIQNTR